MKYFTFTENGTNYSSSYYYVTNLQGDVIAILNANHAIVAEYTYDAWGNILSITNASGTDISGNATHIANLNPLRYRGYVYDTETGFYYLQSRYYDPGVGRFVNLDGFVSTGAGFSGFNMFAYCNNNPVMYVDYSGLKVYPADFVGPIQPGDTYENSFVGPPAPTYLKSNNANSETVANDIEFSFYDSKRINSNASYREQIFVVEMSPMISRGFDENGFYDECFVGIDASFIMFANGWEYDRLDLSLFDLFKVNGNLGFDKSFIGVEFTAAVWSPTITYEFDTFEISIGLDLGISYSYGYGENGFKFSSGTPGLSGNVSVNFK